MTMIEAINAPDLPVPAGHYSHATRTGNLVCVSGQLPMRPDGTHTGSEPFAVQAEQTLSNLRAVLAAADAELKDCIEVTVYLVDWKPARAVVPVGALHYGYLLEIAARAWVERD
jgi:enamine deaminase RidA (YjgF/YER057c/UK114 family)